MIPKLWCWLWGHERSYRQFKQWADETHERYIYDEFPLNYCSRCGTRLKEVEK